ncbi:MAG: hypothetical protein B6U89_02510 [Desulfurococcales archaeon ex4484_58]|nr:MAG: hypothetical protein B6U89_02510 [Desulfurococcales archaeon ex4484_58]
MNEEEIVSEYWFHNYYRVLVVRLNKESYLLSVDVYRNEWMFNDYEERCVSGKKYCLLYKKLEENINIESSDLEVREVMITGVKAGDIYETINVRWIVVGKLRCNDIEKIFYRSWEIIGCKGPRDQPWYHNCG